MFWHNLESIKGEHYKLHNTRSCSHQQVQHTTRDTRKRHVTLAIDVMCRNKTPYILMPYWTIHFVFYKEHEPMVTSIVTSSTGKKQVISAVQHMSGLWLRRVHQMNICATDDPEIDARPFILLILLLWFL